MHKRISFLLTILLLTAGGGILCLPSCNPRGYSGEQIKVEAQALEYYRQGMYRQALLVLESQKNRNVLEQYLVARCYQELREPDRAVQAYRQIKSEQLESLPDRAFFVENYRYHFTRAMIDSPLSYPFSLVLASNFIRDFSPASPHYQDMKSYHNYYQWKSTNWQYFLSLEKPDDEEKRYILLWHLSRGTVSNYSQLLADASKHGFARPYGDLARLLSPDVLKTREDLQAGIDLCLGYEAYSQARVLIERHYKLYQAKDYYLRNLALLDYREGKRSEAIKSLEQWEKTGKASASSIRVLLTWLQRAKRNKEALEVARRATVRIGSSFYPDYIKFLKRTDYYTTYYNWYTSKKKEKGFRVRYGPDAIRTMLRYRPEYAGELLQDYLAHHQSYSMLLLSALWDQQQGQKSSAYRKFLRIVLEYPFSYEWLVARKYESQWRETYAQVFREQFSKKLAQLKDTDLKNRLYLAHGYRLLDSARLESVYSAAAREKDQKQYENQVLKSFEPNDNLPGLQKWQDSSLLDWNEEALHYVEQVLDQKARDKYQRFKYTWKYRALYHQLGQQGYVVSRLATLSQKLIEDRRYHVILPREIQQQLYPLEIFDDLVGRTGSTNTSLWVLAAFREESHFRKKAVSWVGAYGYAQLMPYTANLLKKNLQQPELSYYDFKDNVHMGVTLFTYLFKRYKDNYAYALGAYNGGEGAVNRWRKNFKKYPNEIWIDCVEFDETRDYIKKIMLTRYLYEQLYGMPAFSLADFSRDFK